MPTFQNIIWKNSSKRGQILVKIFFWEGASPCPPAATWLVKKSNGRMTCLPPGNIVPVFKPETRLLTILINRLVYRNFVVFLKRSFWF